MLVTLIFVLLVAVAVDVEVVLVDVAVAVLAAIVVGVDVANVVGATVGTYVAEVDSIYSYAPMSGATPCGLTVPIKSFVTSVEMPALIASELLDSLKVFESNVGVVKNEVVFKLFDDTMLDL